MTPRKLAHAIIDRAMQTPYSHLARDDGTYYMRRFWLVPYNYVPEHGGTGCGKVSWKQRPFTRALQELGIAARVHHIMDPDKDRHLHDHPWWWISVVLDGWYIEAQPADPNPNGLFNWRKGQELVTHRLRKQGSVAIASPTTRHAITTVPYTGVWTLFITFKPRQTWGFYTQDGKVPHDEYQGSAHIQAGQ